MNRPLASLCIAALSFRLAFADGFGNTDYISREGNTVFRASAQKSTSDTNVVAVGRTWTGNQYHGVISSYLTTSGLVDNLFISNTTNGLVGRQLYDFAGAGYDNLCNAIVYAYDGFITGCRSMKANGLYDVYLVKFNNNGILDTSFSTSGIKATGLGGTTGHAFIRGMIYDSATGVGGENGTVVLTGAIGTYVGGVFHPYVAAFSQKTGAQYGSTTQLTGIDGTAVAITLDTANSKYYTASTQTNNNHSFYVHQYNTSLTAAGAPWGTAVDFTTAIGDAAADSVPSSIMMNGTDVITLGGNRVDTTAAWRCAAVAHKTSDGTLSTAFGKVPAPLAAGVDNTGISLFTLNTARDCIINNAVTPPAGSDILPVGTIYNGTNYDFLIAKLNVGGVLDTSFSTDGVVIKASGPADDVLNSAIYLAGSNENVYGAGRSQHSSLYNGGALTQITTTAGTYTDNVLVYYDAAKASSSLGFPGSGCLDTTFRDLSSQQLHGAFLNFTGCGATSGWNGSGSASDAYRLTFDGSNDAVSLGTPAILDFAGTANFGICSWVQTTNTAQNWPAIITKQSGADGQWGFFNSSSNTSRPTVYLNRGAWAATVLSPTTLAANIWYHLCTTYNGVTSKIYLNGIENATANVAGNLANETGDVVRVGFGNTTALMGNINSVQVYNRAITAPEIKSTFDVKANTFRSTPSGNIVTQGLVLNLDAANARLGMLPFANGCAAGNLSWFDLSSSALNGVLTGFASCGVTTGWNGDGTTTISGAAGPYRLTFDGASDYVAIPYNSAIDLSDLTLGMFIRSSNSTQINMGILSRWSTTDKNFILWSNGSNLTFGGTTSSTTAWTNGWTTVADGNWHSLAATRSGQVATIYLDGVQQAQLNDAGNLSAASIASQALNVGTYQNGAFGGFVEADFGNILIYNRALDTREIKQNCNALKHRFSGATCN